MRKVIFSVLLSLAAAGQAWGQTGFQEGVHYFALEQAPATSPDGDVVVTEAFSYLCTHCNTFEPYVDAWRQRLPDGVAFKRLPVEFGRQTWGLYARGYVAASVMGIENDSHAALMNRIWKEQKPARNMEELADFYAQYVDRGQFLATARSFAVDMQLRREQQLVRTYGVRGTPTMIVNGKYRVSTGGAVGDFESMLAVVDFLLARELAGETATPEVAAE